MEEAHAKMIPDVSLGEVEAGRERAGFDLQSCSRRYRFLGGV